MAKFYKLKNIAKISANYAATAGVVAGSFFLGGPITMIAVGTVAAGMTVIRTKLQRNSLENGLVRYPDVHPDAHHLGKIAKELYEASGMKSPEGYPIYNFKTVEPPSEEKKGLTEAIRSEINKMTGVQNAGAVRLGKKPVIMISEPLLRLLNDEEEKAALAHEFAHAAAGHSLLTIPQGLASSVVRFNNAVTQIMAVISAGWVGFLSGLTAALGARTLFTMIKKKRGLLGKDEDLGLSEIILKKRLNKALDIAGKVAFAATLAYFSPAFLGVFAAVKGMSIANSLLSESLSRSAEYQADEGAVVLGADPLALITALKKMTIVRDRSLEAAALHDGKPLPKAGALRKIWKELTADHPATDKRVKRLAKIAAKQGISEEKIQAAVNAEITVPRDKDMPYAVIRTLVIDHYT